MPNRKGKLIVIEGSDGSGKATQSRLLLRRLRARGIPATRIAFPGYARSTFGKMVAAYLRGEYGPSVDPRLAAVLYAGDRFEVADRIREWLNDGKVVICDRYVDSNKAHQAARMPAAQRPAFLKWVDRLEYGVFQLPRPDFTLFLNVPPADSSALIESKPHRAYLKGKKRDAHEADESHLAAAHSIYLKLAAGRGAKSGARIDCVEKGRLLDRSEIADRIERALKRSGIL
jgi:dTMP kinase